MEWWMRRRRVMMRLGAWLTVPIYRALGGRFSSRLKPRAAPPLLLLTTTGRRTGKRRTIPLSWLGDADGTPLIVGTHGGLPTEPAWVHNLRANPEATIQVGEQKREVRASFLAADAAARMWERIIDEYPLYRAALATANREVPIIRLEDR